ncbi:hypothetical protein CANCADRAFT_1672 [Tortispora caseinolytica NRRL Y-17796]|uniref:Alpha/beta hydrolase fold-3 domain-containing protein n=1 Tax=Tortispora caseinolytica NRRL Y-17796 TaxID=767744 RepID=A0A1E4TDW2_9ASCO|nr:hypothetical protein CANCADRAFT_1672 [Tortispora caseinolytica NRRL Y-17796]
MSLFSTIKLGLGLLYMPISLKIKEYRGQYADFDPRVRKALLQFDYLLQTFAFDQLILLLKNPSAEAILDGLKEKAKGFNGYNTALPIPGVKARWIYEAPDRKAGDIVLVCLHGGGFALGYMQGHAEVMIALHKALDNPRVSMLTLDYTTSNFRQYPAQLVETVQLYNWLLAEGHNVIFMGDSAGGNLAIELVAHIKNGAPDVPAVTDSKIPSGLILLSPWTFLGYEDKGSFKQCSVNDYLSGSALAEWASMYVNSDDELRLSPWVSPVNAPADFFEGCIPDNTIVLYGDNESLKDQVLDFVKLANIPSSKVFGEPGAVHDMLLFQAMTLPYEEVRKTFSFKKILEYLQATA